MKEQHSILYLKDASGNIFNFERFSCKTLRGVLNAYRRLVSANILSDGSVSGMAGYFLKDYEKAAKIEIWATSTGGTPVKEMAVYTGSQFLSEIGIGKGTAYA